MLWEPPSIDIRVGKSCVSSLISLQCCNKEVTKQFILLGMTITLYLTKMLPETNKHLGWACENFSNLPRIQNVCNIYRPDEHLKAFVWQC